MIRLILGPNKENIEGLRMDAFSWDRDTFVGTLESSSLFGGNEEALILDNISENSEAYKFIKDLLIDSREFKKDLILLEKDMKAEEVSFFEDNKIKITDLREKKFAEYDFSPFALQDAIGEKSAKKAWIEYNRLLNLGIEAEEIAPKVINKARDMLGILKGADMADLGIKKDFPYNKSKRDLKNWTRESLENFYLKLISLYHEARMGGEEVSTAFEKELLKI